MKTPDIEIYVKQASAELITSWLRENFSHIDIPQLNHVSFSGGRVIQGHVSIEEPEHLRTLIPIVITPRAAGKAFCSIWFKSDNTMWANDEACAQSLLSIFDTEVRCSVGGWSEEEDIQSEQWLSLTQNEKKLIRWE